MKKIIAMLLALVMVFALVACSNAGKEDEKSEESKPTESQPVESQKPDEPAPSESTPAEPVMPEFDGEIVFGHIADLTGVEAMTGLESVTAMDFAVEQMNYAGGIAGKKVVVIHEDSKSSTPESKNAAQKLIENDKVLAILGPTQAGHKGAVGGIVSELKVPAIYYNATPFGMAKGNPYIISAGGGTSQLPTAMADYVFNDMGWRKVYTITQDNTGGQNYMNPFIENFEKMGGEVIEDMWVASGVSDFASYLSKMTGGADGLVAWFSGSDAIKLWSTWYDLGLDKTNPAVVEKILETAVVPVAYSYLADNAENKAFVEAWEKKFGDTPDATNLPGATWGCLQLVKAAVESIEGEVTSEALYQALTKQDIHVPEGHLTFAEGSRLAVKDVYIVKPVKTDTGYKYEVLKTYNEVPATGLVVG